MSRILGRCNAAKQLQNSCTMRYKTKITVNNIIEVMILKRYKPTYKAPKAYTHRYSFLKKRRRASAEASAPDGLESVAEDNIDEDMELNSCSMYDCTGLIPTAVKNRAEAEAYESLYPYIAPAAGKNGNTE